MRMLLGKVSFLFTHIVKRYITIPVMLLLFVPSIISCLLGFEFSNEPYKNIPIVVVNHDYSKTAQDFVLMIESNEVFDVIKYSIEDSDIKTLIDNGTAMAGILIPANFSDNLSNGKQAKVMVFNDGALSPGASSIRGAIAETLATIKNGYLIKVAEAKLSLNPQAAINTVIPAGYTSRILGNPEKKLSYFLIEGLLLTTLQIGAASVGAFVCERRSYMQLLMKAFSCAIAGTISGVFCIWIQFQFFGIPYKGSKLAGLLMIFLICWGCSFIGTIFNMTSKGDVLKAVSYCGILGMTLLLSGYSIPTLTMPPVFKRMEWFIPNTHFIIPFRDIALLGNSFSQEVNNIVWLIGFCGVMFTTATILFRLDMMKNKAEELKIYEEDVVEKA